MGHQLLTLAASATMDPWAGSPFGGLGANQRFVLILTVVGCATIAAVTLGSYIFSALDGAHRRRTEADLKREMLDRGMSVDEVAQVIEAATPPEGAIGRWMASWGCKRK